MSARRRRHAARPAPSIQAGPEYVFRGGVDHQGVVAYVADRFRGQLEATLPGWAEMPPAKLREALRPCEGPLREALKMGPTEYADVAAEARRSLTRPA